MTRSKIANNYLAKFIGILLTISFFIYGVFPISYATGVGRVTWRSITESNSSVGFTPTTLVGTLNNSATTMTVNSSVNYPSPPFIVTIGSVGTEAIDVTAISGTTWTITRGYAGTTALSYSSSANISGPVSAQVQFVPSTPASSIQAIVVDFCTDSPIYNASTCVAPTGMTIGASGASGLAISSVSGISTSLFTTNVANNSSRDDFISSNTGTGYTPSSPTTLGAAITSTSATAITVSSSSAYPAAVNANPNTWFYVNIPSTGETIQVTNVSGTTWTVVRGALGTTAATASNGASLSQPPISFTVYGVMNPTSSGALYARIYTYNNYSTASTFASTSPLTSSTYSTSASANIDAGGVALEIVSPLSISFKVQEYLQFCIYTASGTSTGCNLTGSSVTLGNSSGVLSISNAYVDSSTRFDVATNASGDVAITFTGIPPNNGNIYVESSGVSGTGIAAATAYASSVGHNQFGLCATAAGALYQASGYTSTNLSFPNSTYSGGGNCPTVQVASATYAGSATFGFNIDQIGSVYGDLLAVQQPGTGSTGLISFLGNIAPSTPSGSYTTSLYFTATGTY